MKTRSYEARILSAALSLLMGMTMLPDIGVQTYAYDVGAVIPETDYLTFTAETGNSSVKINAASGSDSLKYKKGDDAWLAYTVNTEIVLGEGESVRFMGSGVRFDEDNHVSVTGSVACSGDVCSLRLNNEGKFSGLEDYCFAYMFYNCTGLTTAPALPATELAGGCYQAMFYNCDGLTTAPALPATQLAYGCYQAMFFDCDGLTTAPALPAAELAYICYAGMFYNCDGLTEAPELPATTLADYCYYNMFSGCTGIEFSETLTDDCKYEYCITAPTDRLSNPLSDMFYGTTGYFANNGTPTVNTTYYMKKSQNSPGADFTAPTAKTGLKYTGKPQELVTAGTASENSQMQYALVESKAATNPNGDVRLSASDIKVGNIYSPMQTGKGFMFPAGYAVKLGDKTYQAGEHGHWLAYNIEANDEVSNKYWIYSSALKTGMYLSDTNNAIKVTKIENNTIEVEAVTVENKAWSTDIPTAKNAGEYTVYYKTVKGEESSDVGSVTATIAKADPAVTAPAAVADLTYTGNEQNLITTGTAEGGTMKYAISNTDNAPADSSDLWKTDYTDITGKDTNTYKVWYKVFANDMNHSDSAAAYIDVSIAQASALKTAPTAKNPTYSGRTVELVNAGVLKDDVTGTIYYMIAEEKPEAGAEGWKTDVTEITADEAGTYKVWYKVTTTDDANYLESEVFETPVTVNVSEYVTPTYYDQTWTLTMDSYEYDGTAHVPTIVGKVHTYANTEVEYTYYNTVTGKELSAAPSEPGKYKVKVFADGGTTHYTRTQWAVYSILEAVSENGQANPASFKDNGVIPKSDGRLFAGWFADSARTTAYTGETDKAYAKFIDEKILTVKAQISSNTTADSEKTSIRFITSVDSLKYQNVGFKIEFNGQTVDQKMTKVYTTINAGGTKVKPTVFSEDSQYMEAFALNNIPNNAYDKEFTVTPYYTTLDGTIVEGETNTFTIANMISK